MKKLKIEKSKYPTNEYTHVLWLETATMNVENSSGNSGYRGIFHGTYQECLSEKERLEGNVSKSAKRSFTLLREALHNRRQKSRI